MKGQKELEYKHYFTCSDGIIYWDKPDLLKAKIFMLENKRGYAIITPEEEKPTVNQFSFYFGGIIRGECMSSNCFTGMNEKEIHQVLFEELRSYTRGVTIKRKGQDDMQIQKSFIEDFAGYGKKKMMEYIEELIPHIKSEFGIVIKDPEEYKFNKYHITQKEK